MGGIRLRTKFLLSMVAVSAALTFTTLLVCLLYTSQPVLRAGWFDSIQNRLIVEIG